MIRRDSTGSPWWKPLHMELEPLKKMWSIMTKVTFYHKKLQISYLNISDILFNGCASNLYIYIYTWISFVGITWALWKMVVQFLHLNVYQCKKLEVRHHQHARARSFAPKKTRRFFCPKKAQKATKLIANRRSWWNSEPVSVRIWCCGKLF